MPVFAQYTSEEKERKKEKKTKGNGAQGRDVKKGNDDNIMRSEKKLLRARARVAGDIRRGLTSSFVNVFVYQSPHSLLGTANEGEKREREG